MGFKFNPTTGALDLSGSGSTAIDNSISTFTAGETISALKAVYIKLSDGLAYVGSSTASDESLVIGIATTAALTGESVSVKTFGEIEDVSWSWAANDLVFLSANGSITNTPPEKPTDSYHVVLGRTLTNNKIMVAIDAPITL